MRESFCPEVLIEFSRSEAQRSELDHQQHLYRPSTDERFRCGVLLCELVRETVVAAVPESIEQSGSGSVGGIRWGLRAARNSEDQETVGG